MKQYTRREALKLGGGGLGAMALGPSVLAACGSSASSVSTTASASGNPAVDVMVGATYLGPPGAVEKFWNEIRTRLSKSDEGVTIGQVQIIPFEDQLPAMQTQTAAGVGSGVNTWFDDYWSYGLFSRGEIAPLDEVVSKEEMSHWLINDTKWGGKTYGAPYGLEISVLGVNRRLFEKAGVVVGTDFESHEQFIEACDKLKAAGITPIQLGTSDGTGSQKWHLFEQLLATESPTDLTRAALGDVSVDSPPYAREREWLPVLGKYANPHADGYTEQMAAQKFLNGEAAMCLVNTAMVFAPTTPSEFDVVGAPLSSAAYSRSAAGAGDIVQVMAFEHNKEAAGHLIEFLHKQEQLQLWWNMTGCLPADDRFDVKGLPEVASRTWDFVMKRPGDLFSLWWPDNFYPFDFAFPYTLTVPAALMTGAMTADQARSATDEVFKKWRTQNQKEIEQYRQFNDEIDQIVKSLES